MISSEAKNLFIPVNSDCGLDTEKKRISNRQSLVQSENGCIAQEPGWMDERRESTYGVAVAEMAG